MPDVLLVQPPIEDFYLTIKRTLPYGLASIAGSLRRAGFSVAIVDALATTKSRHISRPAEMDYLEPFYGRVDRSPFGLFHHFRHFGSSYEHIARLAKASGAFLIGISSLFTAYCQSALETAAAIKKVHPEVRIVLGGHHPTTLPAEVMRHVAVDYVLRGDGEIGLPLLAAALRRGRSPQNVPGLVWRRPDGRLQIGTPAVVQDLEHLPPPALDLIDWHFYQRGGRASMSLTAGRGCPLRCSYCAVNSATYHGFRQRSISAVMAELGALHRKHPIGFIDFEDEHLSADRRWFQDLLAAMVDHFGCSGPELRAMNGLYAPSLDEETLQGMRRAGFQTLNLALITTCPSQLKRFRRPQITSHIARVLTDAHTQGLGCVAYMMVAGPRQEPLAAVRDLLFLAARRVLAGVSVFYPAPGSSDFLWCSRQGLLPAHLSLLRATALPLADATDRIQTVTLLRLGRLLNFMKRLLDHEGCLPWPAPVSAHLPAQLDRLQLGKHLLAAFLHDGAIRGLDAEGNLYTHHIDTSLSRTFLEGLKEIHLRGSR